MKTETMETDAVKTIHTIPLVIHPYHTFTFPHPPHVHSLRPSLTVDVG